MQIVEVSAPAPESRTRRLTDEMRQIEPDPDRGYEVDAKTAQCLRQYGRGRGWKMVSRKTPAGTIVVWRVE